MLYKEFWSKYFKVYDHLNTLIPYQELLNDIARELNIVNGDLILDAGSGTGNLSLKLESLGGIVTGIDYSDVGIAIHKTKQPRINVINADLTSKLPFNDNHFDKICSNNTLYTIPIDKRLALFREFYRILKPCGLIVISNISIDFNPVNIYVDHIRKCLKVNGIIYTFFDLIEMIIPSLRLYYYNYLIKKEDVGGTYNFFNYNDQKDLLKLSNFQDISENKFVYSNQAILNRAYKR